MNSYSYDSRKDGFLVDFAEKVASSLEDPSKEARISIPGVDEFYRCCGYFSEWMGIESGLPLEFFEKEILLAKKINVVVLDV